MNALLWLTTQNHAHTSLLGESMLMLRKGLSGNDVRHQWENKDDHTNLSTWTCYSKESEPASMEHA